MLDRLDSLAQLDEIMAYDKLVAEMKEQAIEASRKDANRKRKK